MKKTQSGCDYFIVPRTASQKSSRAPEGNWNPDNGQVNVNWNDVGNRNDNLGWRPAVWIELLQRF